MKKGAGSHRARLALTAAIAATVLGFAGGCVTAPQYPERPSFAKEGKYEAVFSYLERYVPVFMAEKHVPGLSIVLADDSGIVWAKGFGIADRKKDVPFTADTRSNIGSVSKLLTCAGIMKLVEEGKIDLDSPLQTYLPEFSIKTRGSSLDGITIRRMLTHHSGLPSDRLKEFIFGDKRPADYPDTMLKIPALLAEEYTASAPDTVFSYSNLAYCMLGDVISRVSGKGFAEFMQDEIFEPLGMKDSSFLMTDDERQRMAKGYGRGGPESVPYLRDIPAGAVVSTAADMGKFLSAMLASSEGKGNFLRQETVDEMWRKQNNGVPLDFDFVVGLTWWQVALQDLPGKFIMGHGGDLDAFHALLGIDPESKVGVFIMVNGVDGTGSFSLSPLAAQALRGIIEAKSGSESAPALPAPAITPLPAGFAERATGYYSTPQGLAQVKAEDGRLKVSIGGHWVDAGYHADGSISLEARFLFFRIPVAELDEIGLTLEPIGDDVYLCMRLLGTLFAPCRKVTPAIMPDSWLKRAGRYVIENPDPGGYLEDVALSLDRSSGFFVLEVKLMGGKAMFPLQPVSDTEARIAGYGRNQGETIRIFSGQGGEKLAFQGYILLKR